MYFVYSLGLRKKLYRASFMIPRHTDKKGNEGTSRRKMDAFSKSNEYDLCAGLSAPYANMAESLWWN